MKLLGRDQSVRFWVTLTQGQGHKWVKGQNCFVQITPFIIVIDLPQNVKCSLFSFWNISKYEYCHRTNSFNAPCGLRGCKNRPVPFPGRMSYKVTKPGLVCVLYLSMHESVTLISTFLIIIIVLLLIRAPFYILLIFVGMCSVFWLF